MATIKIHERITAYEVCALPLDHLDASSFRLTVELRGPDSWAVLWRGCALGANRVWEYEPRPSEREDGWLATHRFPLERALELAREVAPNVTVNRTTAGRLAAIIAGEEG